MALFDFDDDGKTGFFDMLFSMEAFEIFSEYCDIKEELREFYKEQREIEKRIKEREKSGR